MSQLTPYANVRMQSTAPAEITERGDEFRYAGSPPASIRNEPEVTDG
jgi:hypothetical protein